ncbi:MAG: hypothetical protein ACHQ1G_13940, partial [Planctomycetota bacterium]
STPLAAGLLLLAALASAGVPPEVEAALLKAKANRAELEKVLAHYAKDPPKLAAAKFLIANMEGHGYVVFSLFDKDGKEVPFDALAYRNFAEAQAAHDALETKHGTLEDKKTRTEDLEAIRADFLIENIDLAFEAWRGHPWAEAIPFEVFCETILPYRASEEPLVPWRRACRDRLAEVYRKLDTRDPEAACRAVLAAAGRWIGFDEIYYLHPTDQGYDEMCRTKLGRCEDISNMMLYAARASATLSATDYTPAWADRDNNHAWEVVLDSQGHGDAPLAHRAAKIYRKTFAIERSSLGAIRGDEPVPRWLSGTHFKDVTPGYIETTDVTVKVEGSGRFAYLCVFNDGEWVAIHWARVEDGSATFTAMGRGIAYLPARYDGKELLPAGPPLLLLEDGSITPLPGTGPVTSLAAKATGPRKTSPDTKEVTPASFLFMGKTYVLHRWEGGWKAQGEGAAGEAPLRFDGLPGDGLYWLVEDGSRGLERIFTIDGGEQRWW